MAILTASARTALRIKLHGRLFTEDAFLIFACLALTTLFTTVLYYTSTTYLAEIIVYDPSQDATSLNRVAVISQYRKAQLLRGSLAWLTIFAVKSSFLSFFYPLTDRLPRLFLYWRVVVAVNVLAFVYCVASGFVGCLESSDENCE